MHCIALSLLSLLVVGQEAGKTSLAGLSERAFKVAFEEAHSQHDADRVDALVQQNPVRVVPLFAKYAKVWIEVDPEPDSEELLALERARLLAESLDSVEGLAGLLDQHEALDAMDAQARATWRQASSQRANAGLALRRGDRTKAIQLLTEAASLFESIGDAITAGHVWEDVGLQEQSLGRFDNALVHHHRSLSLQEPLGNPQDIAMSLHNIGYCHRCLGSFDSSLDSFRNALALRETFDEPSDTASSLEGIGHCLVEQGRPKQALKYLQRALALRAPLDDPPRTAHSLNALGDCHHALGQYDDAIRFLERALSLYGKRGEPSRMAFTLHNLANCHESRGDFSKAIDYSLRALQLRESIGNPQDIADSLNSLGNCYWRLGRTNQAIDCHERAISLRTPGGSPQKLASSFTNLGLCYFDLGQLEKAIECHEHALDLLESNSSSPGTADSMSNLASCYQRIGLFQESIEIFEQVLRIHQAGGRLDLVAVCLNNLGTCHEGLRDYQTAIAYYERAHTAWTKTGTHPNAAHSLQNLGNCFKNLGQPRKAVEYHQRALALRESLGNSKGIAKSLVNLGGCYRDFGEIERARDLCQQGLSRLESLDDPIQLSYALHQLGLIDAALGHIEDALRSFRRSFEQLSSMSLRTFAEQEQSHFRRQFQHRLHAVLAVALEAAPDSSALADAYWITESMRCRALLEDVAGGGDRILDDSDPSLIAQRRQLMDDLEATRLQLELNQGDSTRSGLLRHKLRSTEQELTVLMRRLRRSSSGRMALSLPEVHGVERIRQTALAPQQAVLHYSLCPEQSFLWVLTSGALRLHKIASSQELYKIYERLRAALDAGSSTPLAFTEPARELFDALLAPALPSLASIRHLTIVADGFLGLVPFETLLTAEPASDSTVDLAELPYLLRDKTITYAPSGSFLVFVAQQERSREDWKKDALLLGDPLYRGEQRQDPEEPPSTRSALLPERFERLHMTREEVKSIAAELLAEEEASLFLRLRDLPRSGSIHGSRFDLFVGEEVNEERLSSDLRGYRILHLATHGYFDPEYPWFSGLVLSADPQEEGRSGFMNLLELGTLRLDAEIVFLSACETGRGQILQSEGIQSTAKSFLVAGTHSVVASQWKVRDDTAALLSRIFYRQLLKGMPPAEALRQAKLFLIDGGIPDRGVSVVGSEGSSRSKNSHAHPSLWAPFVLYGAAGGRTDH